MPKALMLAVCTICTFCTIAGCQTTGGSFCQIAKPLRLSDAAVDAMTDAEVEKHLAYLEKGQRLCGWKP